MNQASVYFADLMLTLNSILVYRAPTLYGVPRDKSLCLGDAETSAEPKNIFAALIPETKPLERPGEIPKLDQDNVANQEAPKESKSNALPENKLTPLERNTAEPLKVYSSFKYLINNDNAASMPL